MLILKKTCLVTLKISWWVCVCQRKRIAAGSAVDTFRHACVCQQTRVPEEFSVCTHFSTSPRDYISPCLGEMQRRKI